MIEIIVFSFLAVMAYYDLFNEENIPVNIIYLFIGISYLSWIFEIQSIQNAIAFLVIGGSFFILNKLKLVGEAEMYIFGSLSLFYGWHTFLIISVAYVAFFFKHLGEIRKFSFEEIKKIETRQDAFIPFILIAVLALILARVSI